MVIHANVPSVGFGVVPLERWLCKLIRLCASDLLPEPLSRFHIGTLMDVHAELQITPLGARGGEESKEEPNQPRVAVDEDNPVEIYVGFRFEPSHQ